MKLSFLKKKAEQKRGFVPIDRVRELAGRGFSEPEMIDVLRKEGFSPEEIDSALTEALRRGVTKHAEEGAKEPPKPELPTLEQLIPEKKESKELEVPETSLPEKYYDYSTEDYINAVVEARMSEVDEKIRELSLRYQELEKIVKTIHNSIEELTKARGSEQQKILNRIEEFSSNLNDVNIRLGGVEKAFKETLPALIESVRSLSDLVQRMKREA